jgi:hypothetical protein
MVFEPGQIVAAKVQLKVGSVVAYTSDRRD